MSAGKGGVLTPSIECGSLTADSVVRSIVESIADGLVVITPDGIVRYANAAAEALFGRPRDELVGRTFGYPMQDAEIALPSRGGQVRTGDMRVADAEWDGSPAHVATIREISDAVCRRAYRWRLFRADKRATIARLSAKIAHEVNNPAAFMLANLTVMRDIAGDFAALCDEAGLDPRLRAKYQVEQALDDLREMIDDNEKGIHRIRALIQELKALSRDGVDVVEMIDVNRIVELACQLAAGLLPDRSRLIRDLGEPPPVAIDGCKLMLILIHLIDNAARALSSADDGAQGTITVSTAARDGSVSVTVRDTGCGIPREHHDRIFDAFFSIQPDRRSTSGMGLGLPVVKELCASQGGRIEVDSEPGEGSAFRVILPINAGAAGPGAHVAPGQLRARALLISDDPELCRDIGQMLDPRHDVVDCGGSARAVAHVTADSDYDVVLLDLATTEIDAVTLHGTLAACAPRLAARAVFIGEPSDETRTFLAMTRAILLRRPVSRELLCEVIERMG